MALGKLAEAFVEFGANLNPLSAGLQRAKGMVASGVKGMGSIAQSGLVGLGLAAGIGATVALSLKNFAKQEEAEKGLAAALRATGQEVDNNLGKMKTFASALQSVTTHGDETTLPIMQMGVNLGLTAEQSQEATKAAIGLSKALGINVNEAMKAVSKEMQGQKSALNEQIPGLMDVSDASERLAIISQKAGMGMQEEMAAAETSGGSLTQLKNTLGDLTEMLGGVIASGLTPLVQWFNDLIGVTVSYNQSTGDTSSAVGSAFSSIGSIASSVFSTLGDWLKQTIFFFSNLSTYGKILGTDMAIGFGSMIDAASWAFDNVVNLGKWLWDNMGTLFMDGVNYAITVFSNLGSNLKTFFTGLWSWIKSGGTKGFEEGFKGVSEGFIAQTKSLPEYREWQEGALTKVAKEDRARYKKELEDQRKKWNESFAQLPEQKRKAQEEMANVNLGLTEQGQQKETERKQKEEEKKSKGSTGSDIGFVGLADVWKQSQESSLKKAEDNARKQIEEQKKATKIAEETLQWFKSNFSLNV